jgi:two-component system chemotaxis response regulator CheB
VSGTGRDWRGSRFELVVIVGSLGGLQAASAVLAGLPASFPPPVALLLHGRRGARPDPLAPLLRRVSPVPVRAAESGMCLDGPGVTVIPRGRVATLGEGYRLSLDESDQLGGGDALMASAAQVGGPAVLGVVLTGMLHDGANGARAIKSRGGRVLVQDPRTARAAGMPAAAIATGCIDFVLPLERIAAGVVALTMAPGAAELLAVPAPSWAALYP